MRNPIPMLDGLYQPDLRDIEIFGDLYAPKGEFSHGGWHQIAELKKREGSDGCDVVIEESRMPARFYRVRTLPSVNSVGEPIPPVCLSTGSGDEMGRLILQIAKALRDGMLGADNDQK